MDRPDSDIHRIRLVGPWEYEWLQPSRDLAGRARMPVAWQELFGEEAGTVRFRRRFNWLAPLDSAEEIFVVLAGYTGAGSIAVNESDLGVVAGGPAEFSVTQWLKRSNELRVDLTFDPRAAPGPGGLWGPVLLEVRQRQA